MRKAAIQILSKYPEEAQAILGANLINDSDPNTRLAGILSLVKLPPSDELGKKLYELSAEESIKNDPWLAKAVYAAASRHNKGFITAYLEVNPDYKGEKVAIVQQREKPNLDDTPWKTMELPQYIEKAGLNIDGIIWFRKTIDLPAAGSNPTISLGPVDDSDETWINGVRIGGIPKEYAKERVYKIPSGVLRTGKNVVVVRVEDTGGGGGIYGKAENMFIQANTKKTSLAGTWKYEIEKEFSSANRDVFKDASVAEVFMKNYFNKPGQAESVVSAKGTTVIQLKVIKNQMKYDLKEFTVEARKPVEIVFENPDFMQHNLIIGQVGSLQTIGKAADKLATSAQGAEMNYVPDISEVLFSTKLVNPQQTVRLIFTAPEKAGDYPYVCTFPGHWSIMNGVMKVVKGKPAI